MAPPQPTQLTASPCRNSSFLGFQGTFRGFLATGSLAASPLVCWTLLPLSTLETTVISQSQNFKKHLRLTSKFTYPVQTSLLDFRSYIFSCIFNIPTWASKNISNLKCSNWATLKSSLHSPYHPIGCSDQKPRVMLDSFFRSYPILNLSADATGYTLKIYQNLKHFSLLLLPSSKPQPPFT